ncbi:BnaCnng33950D [Brassica napus]|uniref:BnaCnng33950D protein n=3 Tax=Brassica TaxID=3705 RepID=A0A078J4H8_BRANA|nr:BnaCnng33950D [Brassica napus]
MAISTDPSAAELGNKAVRSSSGGWKSARLIIFVEMAERFAYFGVSSNLITYLTGPLGQPTAAAAANVNVWIGTMAFLPLLWAFVADGCLGRFRTIIISSSLYILGLGSLSFSAMIPSHSEDSDQLKVTLFFCSLFLIAIGQSGYKPCAKVFGADQFDGNDLKERQAKSSYFNWLMFGSCVSITTTRLVSTYIQEYLCGGRVLGDKDRLRSFEVQGGRKSDRGIRTGAEKYSGLIASQKFAGMVKNRVNRPRSSRCLYFQSCSLTSGRSGGVLHVSRTCNQPCGAQGAAAHASGAMRSDTRAATNLNLIGCFTSNRRFSTIVTRKLYPNQFSKFSSILRRKVRRTVQELKEVLSKSSPVQSNQGLVLCEFTVPHEAELSGDLCHIGRSPGCDVDTTGPMPYGLDYEYWLILSSFLGIIVSSVLFPHPRTQRSVVLVPKSGLGTGLGLVDRPMLRTVQGFLDRAAISCELAEIEEAKSVLRLVPIWITCLVYAIVNAQSPTFFTKQGAKMDRSISPGLLVPAAARQCFINISVIVFIPVYDYLFVPITRSFTHIPSGITMLQRIGTGILLSVIAMYVLYGVADGFTMAGLQEFFYDQVPSELRSVGMAMNLSIYGAGNFLSSFMISFIDRATSQSGQTSWFDNDLNKAHLDYFYWLLASLSFIGLAFYMWFAKSYVYNRSNT